MERITLDNAGGHSTFFEWSTRVPTEVGWYWFRATDSSPRDMTRLAECVVYAGRSKDTGSLRCMFHIPIDVGIMAGEWAGPIPSPSH